MSELFALDDGDGRYYLYAPLDRAAAAVNGATLAALNRYFAEGEEALTPAQRAAVESLRAQGLLSATPAPQPVAPADYLFRPYEVTLFPTTRCNLRCVYCYAEAGKQQIDMRWEVAKAAIDFVANNASLSGADSFVVGFHGGGEPLLNWSLVVRAVTYAEAVARERGLTVRVHAASNGCLSAGQREFVAAHFTGINLSIDGPRDVHDAQRTRRGGGGSFDSVMSTVRFFEARGFRYGVRATITEASAPRLTEIVRFFREACPSLDQLHVEPVWYCGRCRTSGARPPADDVFMAAFLDASLEAKLLGLRLFYSGARLDAVTNKFCAAPGDGFSVTPEGIVSSCFEVTEASDARAALFHYGRYDDDAGAFVFDDDRLRRLRGLTVDQLPHCSDCFCKWHCGGDCLAKVLTGADAASHHGSVRCDVNRALTFAEIRGIVDGARTTD